MEAVMGSVCRPPCRWVTASHFLEGGDRMKCPKCGGKMVKTEVRFELSHQGFCYEVETWECPQCGHVEEVTYGATS